MSTFNEFDKRYDIIDVKTPPQTIMCGRYKQSFAYYTIRNRLPVTLTNIIDTLAKDKDELAAQFGEEVREEVKSVVGQLSKLKYELQTDKKLRPFKNNEPDMQMWNNFIQKLGTDNNTFFKACWLYVECYMYRRVSSFFEATNFLKSHDYFHKQKANALDISMDAIQAIAEGMRNFDLSEASFCKLVKLNLWGNRCDLSITSGKEVKPSDNAFQVVEEFNSNLLIDASSSIWKCLMSADRKENVIVDFICDNAGYELFTDLILADYIITRELAHKIRFHVKAIPWFISDVTPQDFSWVLQQFREHKSAAINELGKRWATFVADGRFELQPPEYFWTSPYEFYRMREVNDALYNKLAESRLCIFKGDLNYRKLIGDFTWNTTDDFLVCLRGFMPTNLCTLRTVKADLICGLKPGQAEQLSRIKEDWMTTGEYGVIQYVDTTNCRCTL